MIPLFKPYMDREEIDAVAEVINSGWIGLGPKTKEFEERFAEYINVKHAIALNSATAGLHLALKLLNLPKGSEVITTPITFISTAFAPLYCDLRPVFADIQEDSLNINPEDIKKKITPKTKAIIPVHYGGHPCDMKEIQEIADEHNLIIIEDAAHACGSEYEGKKIGSLNLTIFSFAAIKNLSTGDGGMITTNNDEFNERLRKLRWLGITSSTFSRASKDHYKWDYDVEEVGYKFHPTDVQSAIGLVQLKKLEKSNQLRNNIFKRYNEEFEKIDWIKTPVHKKNIKSSCHNYTIKIDENREELIRYLDNLGISAGVHYKPLYMHKVFRDTKVNCPVTDKIWKKLITLPMFPSMIEEEINKVVNAVKSFK